ncbi:hypothetical protein FRC02_007831 [Tulasnella sp. 418]|nr:hypothetical protein FRC02_007831 [Tulasnella sp. 418]
MNRKPSRLHLRLPEQVRSYQQSSSSNPGYPFLPQSIDNFYCHTNTPSTRNLSAEFSQSESSEKRRNLEPEQPSVTKPDLEPGEWSEDEDSLQMNASTRPTKILEGLEKPSVNIKRSEAPQLTDYAREIISRTSELRSLLDSGVKTRETVHKHPLSSRQFKTLPHAVLVELAQMSNSETWRLLINEMEQLASKQDPTLRRTIKEWLKVCLPSNQAARRYMGPLIEHYRSSLYFRDSGDKAFAGCR